MKRYEKYKPSGIDWIGDVPSNWNVKRGRFIIKLLPGFPADSDSFTDDDTFIPLIRIRDIDNTTTEKFYNGEFPKEYLIKKSDVLVGMDGDFNISEWKGEDALLNQRVCKVIGTNEMISHYAYYLFRKPLKLINDVTYSTTVKHLSTTDIKDFRFPVPPLEEQTAIAAYLDAKCAKIDNVVAVQQQRIELLKELKQSIISHAVTKGLNKNAKMKDSGVEWIGEVPEGWEKIHLKYTTLCKDGLFIDGDWIESKDLTTDSDGIRYLTSGNVGIINYKEQGDGYITEKKFKELDCTEVFPGDIIISRLNEPIGRACIVPQLNKRIVCAVDNVICRTNDSLYDKKYLVYQMNCKAYSEYANCLARGTGMHRISRSMLGQMTLLVPPLPEQTAIAAYLDKKCAIIDRQIAKVEKQIELLKEYKQSIITECVTGKRKVC